MRKWFVFVTAVLTFFVFGAAPGATSSGVSTVEDAIGDSTHLAPYMDVLSARVQQKDQGTLFFMELAEAIPDTPPESSLMWVFHVDTDPNSSPGGLYVDYVPRVRWNGSSFVGEVLNRLTTPPSITPDVPFKIKGATVRLTVDPALLGSPPSFGWNAATRPSPAPGVNYTDFAPGCLTCLLTWTAK